jgi:dihydrofolate synthase/folylpolyglutamate synthase
MKLGLENITRLLELLSNPQKKIPAILVGGTNGKGSATAYISSILRASGRRVGTFYSPHLFRINERIRLDGEEIPSPVLDAHLGRLRRLHSKAPFTFFEGITASALLHFVTEGADVAVFEVGLGGRLDATRLVDAGVTVITGIAIDHGEHLGATRHRILGEKLGIIREGVPLVARLGTRALIRAAAARCSSEGVPFYSVSDEVETRITRMEPEKMHLELSTPYRKYGEIEIGMIGEAQAANVATAVRAVEVLDRRIGKGDVARGLSSAFFTGRFQVLSGAPRIILDVSHNEEALINALRTLRAISPPERNVVIFGILAHKKLGAFPARVSKSAREVILTPLPNGRSAEPTDLAPLFRHWLHERAARITTARGMGSAIRLARSHLHPDDTLLILGSHLAVEEAAAYL